jgi:hypothetical protein
VVPFTSFTHAPHSAVRIDQLGFIFSRSRTATNRRTYSNRSVSKSDKSESGDFVPLTVRCQHPGYVVSIPAPRRVCASSSLRFPTVFIQVVGATRRMQQRTGSKRTGRTQYAVPSSPYYRSAIITYYKSGPLSHVFACTLVPLVVRRIS